MLDRWNFLKTGFYEGIKYSLIHGEEKAGKTALARHMYLTLVGEFQPVLLLHSEQVGVKPFEALIRDSYGDQFYGDYTLWLQQHNKTLILDNMTDEPHLVELVVKAKAMFDSLAKSLCRSD